MKALLLFLLPDKGWGVDPCCTDSFNKNKPKKPVLFSWRGCHSKPQPNWNSQELSVAFLPHFSFIYATCCCPVIAQAQQETRMKGRGTNTCPAGLCFPRGAAGSKNYRDYIATCPEAKC